MKNVSAISSGRKKFQLFILILLVITLPLAVYVALRQTYFKGKAAGTSTLSLVPQGLTQPTPGASWQFPLNQDVNVNLVLKNPSSRIQAVEAKIQYDPTVLQPDSTSPITYSPTSLLNKNALTCNPTYFYSDYVSSNPVNCEQTNSCPDCDQTHYGAVVHIARTAIPLTSCNQAEITNPDATIPPYAPEGLNSTGSVVATFKFRTLKATANSAITLLLPADNPTTTKCDESKNFSSIATYCPPSYLTPPAGCVGGAQDLSTVENVTFSIAGAAPTATVIPVSPTPSCPRKNEGDSNCDGIIDYFDFNKWRSEYLIVPPTPTPSVYQADFDGNGIVNYFDFNKWRNTYVREHTTPTP